MLLGNSSLNTASNWGAQFANDTQATTWLFVLRNVMDAVSQLQFDTFCLHWCEVQLLANKMTR
jgi:hypothetical protein